MADKNKIYQKQTTERVFGRDKRECRKMQEFFKWL